MILISHHWLKSYEGGNRLFQKTNQFLSGQANLLRRMVELAWIGSAIHSTGLPCLVFLLPPPIIYRLNFSLTISLFVSSNMYTIWTSELQCSKNKDCNLKPVHCKILRTFFLLFYININYKVILEMMWENKKKTDLKIGNIGHWLFKKRVFEKWFFKERI